MTPLIKGEICCDRHPVAKTSLSNREGIGFTVGHAFSEGEAPKFHKGAFIYRAKKPLPFGAGVTLGLFVTVDPTPFDAAINQYLVFSPDFIEASDQLIAHELGHV